MKKLFDLLHIKKVGSLLIALCLVVGLMPMTAYAAACYLSYAIDEGAGNSWVIKSSNNVSDRFYMTTGTAPGAGNRTPMLDDLVEFWFDIEPGYALKSLKAKKYEGTRNEDVYVSAADLYITENDTPGMSQKYYTKFYLEQAIVIELLTRRCVMTVKFDSNGGSGTMASQTFEYDIKQDLSENSFSNAGYTFAGWNTEADGSGTPYDDSVETVFYPESDKEITLYAQWIECTDHSFVNGVCEKCDAAGKGIPATDDFIFAIPDDSTYDGSVKQATVVPNASITGMGEITVKYYDENGHKLNGAPVDAGIYTVKIDVADGENYKAVTDLTFSDWTFTIAKKPVTVTASASDKVYDGNNSVDESAITLEFSGLVAGETIGFTIKEAWYDSAAVGENRRVPIIYNVTGDAAKNYIFPTGGEYIAPDYYVEATADITPKELTIIWGNSDFVYDETEKFPEYTVEGIVDGDVVEFICVGAATDARHEYIGVITGITGEDSANYALVGTPTKEFTIAKADQDAPVGLGKNDETAPGMADGTITGITAGMEYRKGNEADYTAVSGNTLENLAPGTYYVRYAGDTNHNPSDAVEVTINAKTYYVVFDFNGGNIFGFTEPIEVPLNVNGTLTDNVPWPTKEGHTFLGYFTEDDVLIEDPGNYIFTQNTRLIAHYAINEYTVTVPAEQIGYRLETDVSKIEHGGEVYISFALKEGYEKTDAFAVKVNGKEIELTEYNNVVVHATEDLVITVEGVAPKTSEPNDPTTPNTGDNSNMVLWIALLLISSGSLITLTGVERKRRIVKR